VSVFPGKIREESSLIRKSTLSCLNLSDIRKRVICNDCLTEEIQIAVDDNPTRKKAVHKVVIMNRLKTFMQNMTSLSSRKLLSGFQEVCCPSLNST
jgi:hypothetical protein